MARLRSNTLIRVLLTGFGAFPGAPTNPTQAIVRSLNQRHKRSLERAGIDLRIAILPVVYGETKGAIERLLRTEQPDVVLHLGLAAGRETISVEMRARNRLSVLHPDAAGRRNLSMNVEPGREAQLATRWPVERLAVAISHAGFPAHRSIDAGDYLCNQTLYHSLRLHKGLCGFLHVPMLRKRRRFEVLEQHRVEIRPALPTLADLERCVMAAIRLLAAEHRRLNDKILSA